MKTRHCCQIARRDRDNAPRPASRWRHGGEIARWIIPSATLVLLPKCPLCVAMYVALFSGVSISIASAAHLRTSVLVLCVVALVGRSLWALTSQTKTRSLAQPQVPARQNQIKQCAAR